MLDPAFTFERFVVDGTNELAVDAARRTAESPGAVDNPLLICGRGGVGKTHLLHAIGHLASTLHPDLVVRIESVGSIAERVTAAAAGDDARSLYDALATVGLLLIDDAERIGGMQRTQEELAALGSRMTERGHQLVLASILPTQELPDIMPPLGDLFARGLVVEIGPPEGPTRQQSVQENEFGDFLDDVSRTLAAVVETPPWHQRVAEETADEPLDDAGNGERAQALLPASPPEPPLDTASIPGKVPDADDSAADPWFLNRAKIVLSWIDIEGRLVENPH